MEAVWRCVSVDGAEKVESRGAPRGLVWLRGECDACFAVTMYRKKGRVVYTCLVDRTSKFGTNGKCKCFEKKWVDIRNNVTISDSDGEGCGLNTVVRAWLKDNGGSGFVGM